MLPTFLSQIFIDFESVILDYDSSKTLALSSRISKSQFGSDKFEKSAGDSNPAVAPPFRLQLLPTLRVDILLLLTNKRKFVALAICISPLAGQPRPDSGAVFMALE